MPRRLLLAAVPLVSLFALVASCAAAPPAAIALVLRAPQGLLDQATKVTVSVFDPSGATCLPSGHVDAMPSGSGVEVYGLARGCPDAASYCAEIELEQDGSEKMFAVVATGGGVTLAEGCATATIDRDPVEVAIKVQRYNPPPCCNDGALQTGEQCDPVGATRADCAGNPAAECLGIVPDDVCECDCTAKEIPLDRSPADPYGPVLAKSELALAFCPGGSDIPNALRAAFTDAATTDPSTDAGNVSIRVLSADLYPVTVPFPLSLPLEMPLRCTAVQAAGSKRRQSSPAIAPVTETATAVVHLSDEKLAGSFDVLLSHQNEYGCADVAAVQLNTSTAAPGSAEPDVAASGGLALAVWSRGAQIFGRIWAPGGSLVPAAGEIAIGGGAHPRLAGWQGGFLLVYQGSGPGDGDGIFARRIDVAGVVLPEVKVNAAVADVQDQPDVAALADGRAIVVWRSGGDVWMQRFDAAGVPLSGDQDAPLDTTADGLQSNPAAAASIAAGEFFAVAWEDTDAGTISARFAGASGGFGFNSVTGQNDAFVASHPAIPGVRRLPSVAIGGGGFVAIGWQDEAAEHPGVYVRRFPLPQ